MIKIFFSIFISCLWLMSYGQEPFDVPSVDYPEIKIHGTPDYTKVTFGGTSQQGILKADSISTFKDNFNSFSQQNIGFTTNGDASSLLPNIQTNVIQYRLRIFSWEAKKAKAKRNVEIGDTLRFYLPVFVLSKLSMNYDSAELSSLTDATGFLGSPFTFRMMPNIDIKVGLENLLTIGHISDFRSVLARSPDGKLTPEFGYYGALGLKYSGEGDVRIPSGQRFDGNWSFAVLGYVFTGTKNARSTLFTGESLKTGLEGLFKFKVAETKFSRFNLTASFQFEANPAPGASPWIFKFGFGN